MDTENFTNMNLRCGNHVYHKGVLRKVIGVNEFSVILDDEELVMFDSIEPIPINLRHLSNEWGFTKNIIESHEYYTLPFMYNDISNENGGLEAYRIEDNVDQWRVLCSFMPDNHKGFNYVHEIENFYYDINGIEIHDRSKNVSAGWSVIDYLSTLNQVHVIPDNDVFEHTVTTECDCSPKIEKEDYVYDNGNSDSFYMVSHNSYDGREALEQANSILKQKISK